MDQVSSHTFADGITQKLEGDIKRDRSNDILAIEYIFFVAVLTVGYKYPVVHIVYYGLNNHLLLPSNWISKFPTVV